MQCFDLQLRIFLRTIAAIGIFLTAQPDRARVPGLLATKHPATKRDLGWQSKVQQREGGGADSVFITVKVDI